MVNIWGFLLQTGTVTLVALLILAIKEILKDKLSPRWQYGIWSVLALRCLIPADPGKSVLLPLGWWLETWKGSVEAQLSSAFSAQYTAIRVDAALPFLTGRPGSWTDWLFVIYAAGVVLSGVWYLAGYVRLRLALRRGEPCSDQLEAQVLRVCREHGLAACPVREVEGIRSAFVCGVFRPVLIVPAGEPVDDKVLLHELLHLKYQDALQNFFWCAMRCLHWCSPMMHRIFDRVGNDMESLCDQRVLERLEGEQRRDYGRILLAMASDRYPRAPGTTSISNGGRNIARRIEAIVRFQKYPRGMELVSVCIIVILLIPTLSGSAADYGRSTWAYLEPGEIGGAMAMARLERCETPLGAADCWARGMLMENGIYVAMASPPDAHEDIAAEMKRSADEGWYANRYYPGWEIDGTFAGSSYEVLDLVEQPDGSYRGYIVFRCWGLYDEEEVLRFLDDEGNRCWGYTLVPVRILESDGWVVEESGPRSIFWPEDLNALVYTDGIAPLRTGSAETAVGRLTISARSFCEYDLHQAELFAGHYGNTVQTSPDAALTGVDTRYQAVLECAGPPKEKLKLELYLESGIYDRFEFPEPGEEHIRGAGGSDSTGYAFETGYADAWTGTVTLRGWTDSYPETVQMFGRTLTFRYRITLDGEVIDEGEVAVE